MIRYCLFISIFIPILGFSQEFNQLKFELENFKNHQDLKNAGIGIYAVDLNSKQILCSVNPDLSLIPASITKIITTATGLEVFGANHRFVTELYYDGNIDSTTKTLRGNIIVKGGGDPALGSHRFEKLYSNFYKKWADEIKLLGIDSIEGKVIADASLFNQQMIPSTWIWGDIGNYYGAGTSGLSVHENMFIAQFQSGKRIGDSTIIKSVKPYIPNLEIENLVISDNTAVDESFFYGGPYQYNKMVRGEIPLDRSNFEVKGSIPDPALLLAYEFTEELRKAGIKISSNYSTTRIDDVTISYHTSKLISVQYSPELSEIIQQINFHSINLYAEHLINHLGVKQYQIGSTEKGAEAIVDFWKNKGFDIKGMYLNDGSGLSRFNSFSSKQLVDILLYMKNSNNFKTFYSSMPLAGVSGTVRSLGKGTFLEGNARIKSGYMTRVRSYAGYIKTKSNRDVGFAIMVNNYNCSPQVMKKLMEKLMVQLAEINE